MKKRKNPPAQESIPMPPSERNVHDKIERFENAISDDRGIPSRPYRVVDILAKMERSGKITPAMRQAGDDFRSTFNRAQLDPLKAADYSRPMVSGRRASDGPGSAIERARDTTWRALCAVGGIGSPGGSCLWHVVGWERPLKEWATVHG
jgi:hypothetical protein